jgi:hypothetical protein
MTENATCKELAVRPIRLARVLEVLRDLQCILRPVADSVWIAGGAVRDAVLKRTPKDYDIFFHSENRPQNERVRNLLGSMEPVPTLPWHRSEPFLVDTRMHPCGVVQIMWTPHKTLDALIDSFDWNVALFGYDSERVVSLTDPADIAEGKPLVLHRVTFPLSTLRRGLRYSERFGMQLKREDLERLCKKVAVAAAMREAGTP